MELILLTSAFLSAFFLSFFILGFFIGTKFHNKNEDFFKITDQNEAEAVKRLYEWLNYDGGMK